MPVVIQGATYPSVLDVNSRTRSIVNDDNAQLWPDGSTGLLNAVRDGYNWLFGQIQRIGGQALERVIQDVAYTPTTSGEEQNISAILPADIYFPVLIEFRLSSTETYTPLDRRQKLPSRNNSQLERLTEWEFRGNNIFVISSNQAGLLKITYRSLLPIVMLTGDPILFINSVEAISHYAAYELFRRRGQMLNAQAALGDDGTRNGSIPTGAKGFASLILDHIIMDEQEIPRRGIPFGDGSGDSLFYRRQT